MEQKIAFDPALGRSAADLGAAWNGNPTTAAHGRARVEPAQPGQFMDFADVGFMVVSSIALNLLSSYLYDLIKDAFADKPAPTIVIHPVEQPNGEKLVVVVVEKP